MESYDKIRRLGHSRNTDTVRNSEDTLLFKEKVDGANFRFTVIEHEGDKKLLFGSKNVEYKINGKLDCEKNVDSRFKDAINFIREKVVAEKVNKDYTFFVENMVKHSLDYNWSETPQVIGFDIYNNKKEKYLKWDKTEEIFKELGITTTPLVEKKKVEKLSPEDYKIPESNYRDGKMEGVVIINQDQEEDNRSGFSTRAKIVSEEFKEKHKKQTGARQSVEAIKGHEKIISKYCTQARIKKHIHKMRDEGRDLGRELMGSQGSSDGLPIRVAADIIEEEADQIIRRNDEMNWKNYRSLIADRCLRTIEEQMQKKAGGRTQK